MKEIKNFSGYFVTPDGKVYSTNGRWDKSLKQLRVKFDRRGYHRVTLCQPHRKTFSVHRLVAETFIPNPNNLPQVDHLDGNKNNNCVDNLEWVDNQTNMERAFSKQHYVENTITGEVIVVYNLCKWCRDNKLSHSTLRNREKHKGWKLISV